MNRLLKLFSSFCVVMLGLLIFSGCAGLGPANQVLPSSVDRTMTLEQLRANMDSYTIMQSGPVFNPSALLFVPRERDFEVRFTGQWSKVESVEELNDRIVRLKNLNDPTIKLWALLAPSEQEAHDRDLLGYIYTAGMASIRQGDSADAYVIRDVPERFNPIYYDRSDDFGVRLER